MVWDVVRELTAFKITRYFFFFSWKYFAFLQCCGSGSAWICINLKGKGRIRIEVISWIRIRINL